MHFMLELLHPYPRIICWLI